MFWNKVKSIFKTTIENTNEKIFLNNWSLLINTYAIYNIIQIKENVWNIDVSIFINDEDAFVLPLAKEFSSYILAYQYIQKVGPLFLNTSTDVFVIDMKQELIAKLDLLVIPSNTELIY